MQRKILTFYINLQMQSQAQFIENHPNEKKNDAVTPATAQSFILNHSPEGLEDLPIENQKCRFSQDYPLFNIVQEHFQDKFLTPDPSLIQKNTHKVVVQESVQSCCLEVGLRIFSEKKKLQKYFLKQINKITEDSENGSIVFNKQHEKAPLAPGSNYTIEIFLISTEGFERKISTKSLKISESPKKWETFSLKGEQEEGKFQLFLQTETYHKVFLKPLGIKLPLQIIDNFFDQKFQLLNKSDLLNTIQSIVLLKGILLPLTKQNMGSRIIQKLLKIATVEEVDIAIEELKDHLFEMIPDRYGNYVVQKMLKAGNYEQRKKLLSCLLSEEKVCKLKDLIKTKAGTHSLQALLDFLSDEDINKIYEEVINKNLQEICTDQFGFHFVQKMLSRLDIIKFVNILSYKTVQSNLFCVLCTNKYGVVLIKQLLKISNSSMSYRYELLQTIMDNFQNIAYNQYGHYIIEELLQYYNYYELESLLQYMSTYISYISKNQYSSSIIRKCIEIYGDYVAIPCIQVLTYEEGKSGVDELMENNSGCFVLHRLMEQTQDQNMLALLQNMMKLRAPKVRCYEKKQKWIKFFNH